MWLRSCGEICHVETFLHMTDFSTFLHIPHFSPHLSCGELSQCNRFSSYFSCGKTSPHENLSYGKNSPHDRFFSTSTACGACDKFEIWVKQETRTGKDHLEMNISKWVAFRDHNRASSLFAQLDDLCYCHLGICVDHPSTQREICYSIVHRALCKQTWKHVSDNLRDTVLWSWAPIKISSWQISAWAAGIFLLFFTEFPTIKFELFEPFVL